MILFGCKKWIRVPVLCFILSNPIAQLTKYHLLNNSFSHWLKKALLSFTKFSNAFTSISVHLCPSTALLLTWPACYSVFCPKYVGDWIIQWSVGQGLFFFFFRFLLSGFIFIFIWSLVFVWKLLSPQNTQQSFLEAVRKYSKLINV